MRERKKTLSAQTFIFFLSVCSFFTSTRVGLEQHTDPKHQNNVAAMARIRTEFFISFFYFKSSPLLQSQRERHSSAHFHCGTNFRPSSALWTEPASSRLTRRSGDGTCGPDDTSEHHKRVESGRLKQHVPDHRYDPDGCTGHPVEEHPCEHNRLVLTQLSHLSPVRLQTSDKVLLAHRLLSPLF